MKRKENNSQSSNYDPPLDNHNRTLPLQTELPCTKPLSHTKNYKQEKKILNISKTSIQSFIKQVLFENE